MLFMPEDHLAPMIFSDTFQSRWKNTVDEKVVSLGFSKIAILAMGYTKAKENIHYYSWDTELQNHITAASIFPAFKDRGWALLSADYLISLTIPKCRKAFTLAKFSVLSSAVLKERYNNVPYCECLCLCEAEKIETVGQVLLYCSFYCDLRRHFINPILQSMPGRYDVFYIDYLLADQFPEIIAKMHWDFDMFLRTRVDTSPTVLSWDRMRKYLFGFIGFMLVMFGLGEIYPSYQPVGPKQYPYNNLYLEKGGDPKQAPPEVKNYEI